MGDMRKLSYHQEHYKSTMGRMQNKKFRPLGGELLAKEMGSGVASLDIKNSVKEALELVEGALEAIRGNRRNLARRKLNEALDKMTLDMGERRGVAEALNLIAAGRIWEAPGILAQMIAARHRAEQLTKV